MLGKGTGIALSVACLCVVTSFPYPKALPGEPDSGSSSGATVNASGTSLPRATVEGRVTLPPQQVQRRRFRGRAYRQRTNRGSRDPSTQNGASRTRRYSNVIVSAHPRGQDPEIDPLPEPVEIDQQDATFRPHVTPITPGTTVEFVNSDPFYHNVFSLTPGARFNIGRRPTGVSVEEVIPQVEGPFPELGVVELHCDIHPEMNAFIVTLQTPYFTRANDDGTYILEDLPPGQYRIYAYTARDHVTSFEVELGENERVSRSIDLR